MFRTRGPSESAVERVDDAAAVELIVRLQRLSRRLLLGTLALAILAGVTAANVATADYHGPRGNPLGARLGVAFVAAAAVTLLLGMALRKVLVRRALARWIDEMAARGVGRGGLVEALESFL